MDFLYKSTNKLLLAISGDRQLRAFTLQKALFNVLGFSWWKGGLNLPLPAFVKQGGYLVLCVGLVIYLAIMTIIGTLKLVVDSEIKQTLQLNGIIITMPFMASILKVFYIWIMRKKLKELIDQCDHLGYPDVDKEPINSDIKACHLYTHMLLTTAGTWVAYFSIVHRELPFATQFPWSQDKLAGWYFGLLTDLYGGVNCCFIHALLDTIFPMSVSVVVTNVEKLKKYLANIGSNKALNVIIIKESVNLHNKLLRLCRLMNICFDEVCIAQSLYTVLHACFLTFTVAKVQNKFSVLATSFPLLLCSYAQLWMYCSFGQTLTDKFDELSFALYNNRWYMCDISTSKALVTISEVCQKHVGLKIVGSITSSLTNFMHRIQDSLSYFLILKTVTNGTADAEY